LRGVWRSVSIPLAAVLLFPGALIPTSTATAYAQYSQIPQRERSVELRRVDGQSAVVLLHLPELVPITRNSCSNLTGLRVLSL